MQNTKTNKPVKIIISCSILLIIIVILIITLLNSKIYQTELSNKISNELSSNNVVLIDDNSLNKLVLSTYNDSNVASRWGSIQCFYNGEATSLIYSTKTTSNTIEFYQSTNGINGTCTFTINYKIS